MSRIIIALALALAATMAPISASAEEVASAQCTVFAEVNEDGTLETMEMICVPSLSANL